MKVNITQVDLISPFHFFKLSWNAMFVMRQLKKTNYVDFKQKGLWMRHYTMTMWHNDQDMVAFARSGAHLEAMKKSKSIARSIKSITIEADKMPDWKAAKKLVNQQGKGYTIRTS